MRGQQLHTFDLLLSDYVRENISHYMERSDIADLVKSEIDAALVAYFVDDEPKPEQPFLLSDSEFEALIDTFGNVEPVLDPPWIPNDRIYRRSIDTITEVRDALGDPAADEWAKTSNMLASRIEREHACLDNGIQLVQEWSAELRRLLKAMHATSLLPAPDGTFPTPTCPDLPTLPVDFEGKATETSAADLAAAVAEIREIRDILLNQRQIKECYSTSEVAVMLGKAEFTVREWCRLGQCRGDKKKSYRGGKKQWMIPHDELLRLQNEGPAPLGTHRLPSSED